MTIKIQEIACGGNHSLVLLSDGSVWVSGNNFNGEFGDGTTHSAPLWKPVFPEDSGFVQIAAGASHSLALKSDGSVWATGDYWCGQTGNKDTSEKNKNKWTQTLPPGSDIIQLATNYYHSLLLKSNGEVLGSGWNTC